MRLAELELDFAAKEAAGELALELDFPETDGKRGGPRAVLSLRGAGSMLYRPGLPNRHRAAFFASLGLDGSRVVATELHHTRRVRLVSGGPPAPEVAEGAGGAELDAAGLPGEDGGDGGPDGAEGRDGILVRGGTGEGRLVPSITVADCLPIWLLDRDSGSYGVLHSGWKGTGILAEAVGLLVARLGSRPSSMTAIVGPGIGSCCYEVPRERALAFEGRFGGGTVDWAARHPAEGPRIDLRAANIAMARDLGLGALLSVDACSSCDPGLGSYRREGAGAFTRMVALCLPA